jgi:hypothetical protein
MICWGVTVSAFTSGLIKVKVKIGVGISGIDLVFQLLYGKLQLHAKVD